MPPKKIRHNGQVYVLASITGLEKKCPKCKSRMQKIKGDDYCTNDKCPKSYRAVMKKRFPAAKRLELGRKNKA